MSLDYSNSITTRNIDSTFSFVGSIKKCYGDAEININISSSIIVGNYKVFINYSNDEGETILTSTLITIDSQFYNIRERPLASYFFISVTDVSDTVDDFNLQTILKQHHNIRPFNQ